MFKRIKEIFLDEVKIVASDHSILLTVIVAPMLYAFFLGSIYIFKDESNVKLGIVDMDRTMVSRSIVTALNSTQKVEVINELDDYAEAIDKVNSMEINGFLFIPHNFERDLKRMKGADLPLFLNTTRFLPSNDINKTITKTVLMAGAGIRLKYFQATEEIPSKLAMTQVMPLIPNTHILYNPTSNYGDFLLAGLFLLILHQTMLIGFGESIALTRQKREGKKLYERSGRNIFLMMNAKGSFYFLLFSATALFFFTVVFQVFEISFKGNVFLVAVFTFFFLLSVVYYTIFLASFFKTQSGLMEVFAFTSYPIFLVSGYSWPLDSMPIILQWIAKLVPLTPYYDGILRITQMGAEFRHVQGDLIHLVIIMFIAMGAAYIRMRVMVKRET